MVRFPKVLKQRKVFKAFKKAGFRKVSQSGSLSSEEK